MTRLLALFAFLASPLFAQDAVYRVEVFFDWRDGPEDRHWSRLIAFAHSSRYNLFEDGDTASSGLALVATNGRVSVMNAELAEGRRRGRVGESIVVPGIDGVGSFAFDLPVTNRLSRISFATMLAPSPDWFSGTTAMLRQDGAWVEQLDLPLWVWDAGADSGPDFVSDNAPTQPRQSVRLLTHPAFLRPEGLMPIGHARFLRLH